jgi:hypothetical protein
MKYSEKKRGKALTLGQLRVLVAKLDGVPDNAVVRHGNLRAKEISVDENELLDGPPMVAAVDEFGNPGMIESPERR